MERLALAVLSPRNVDQRRRRVPRSVGERPRRQRDVWPSWSAARSEPPIGASGARSSRPTRRRAGRGGRSVVAEHDVEEIELSSIGCRGWYPASCRRRDLPHHPHYAARARWCGAERRAGDVAMAAPVPRFSLTPGRIKHTGSPLGSDTSDFSANSATKRPRSSGCAWKASGDRSDFTQFGVEGKVLRRFPCRRRLSEPTRPDAHRDRQHMVHGADHEHESDALQRDLRRSHRVRPPARRLDPDAGSRPRVVGRGYERERCGESGLGEHQVAEARLRGRHALGGIRSDHGSRIAFSPESASSGSVRAGSTSAARL